MSTGSAPPPASSPPPMVLRALSGRSDPAVERAARLLAQGSLVAFPTETVYGLGADATDADAVERIFVAKGRPRTDPLIVHVTGLEQAQSLGDLGTGDASAAALAEAFWPGPLTVVVPRRPGVLAPAVGGGRDTVGLRSPAHPVALALIEAAGVPVAAPSANRFGRVSPTDAAAVVSELGGAVDLVLDGGPTPLGVESTVVACGSGPARLLRPGGVPVEDLRAVVADLVADPVEPGPASEPAEAPGTFTGHYAPSVPLTLVESGVGVALDLAAALGRAGAVVSILDLPGDGRLAARELYRRLRALDDTGADLALACPVDPGGLGRAVNDRLLRAAHGHLVTDAGPASVERILARCRPG